MAVWPHGWKVISHGPSQRRQLGPVTESTSLSSVLLESPPDTETSGGVASLMVGVASLLVGVASLLVCVVASLLVGVVASLLVGVASLLVGVASLLVGVASLLVDVVSLLVGVASLLVDVVSLMVPVSGGLFFYNRYTKLITLADKQNVQLTLVGNLLRPRGYLGRLPL